MVDINKGHFDLPSGSDIPQGSNPSLDEFIDVFLRAVDLKIEGRPAFSAELLPWHFYDFDIRYASIQPKKGCVIQEVSFVQRHEPPAFVFTSSPKEVTFRIDSPDKNSLIYRVGYNF